MQTPPISTRQQKSSFSTPKVVRRLKTDPGSDSDYSVSRTPKDRLPKVVPRNLANLEKKKPTKLSQLEIQVSQLQDELNKAKLEAGESKKRWSAKLEETQNQLDEISESEDNRIQQLREISHSRDLAWQSELEAVQKQSSMESAALASEIHKLRNQLERVSESEGHLRAELTETLDLVRTLKEQLDDSRKEVSQVEMELEVIKTVSAVTTYDSLVLELEESKNRVKSLVRQMSVEVKKSESEILRNEVRSLRSKLESAEKIYEDEYIQRSLEIREAYKLVEFQKREAEKENQSLEVELKKLESEVESMKQENKRLRLEIEKRENDFETAKLKMNSEAVKKATRMGEELDATQATNSELEAELRRLKVQSDQWRKAAEAAAAIISGNGNGKCVERMGISRQLDSDDTDDEEGLSPKKPSGNVLTKIGVLLKKGHK